MLGNLKSYTLEEILYENPEIKFSFSSDSNLLYDFGQVA